MGDGEGVFAIDNFLDRFKFVGGEEIADLVVLVGFNDGEHSLAVRPGGNFEDLLLKLKADRHDDGKPEQSSDEVRAHFFEVFPDRHAGFFEVIALGFFWGVIAHEFTYFFKRS